MSDGDGNGMTNGAGARLSRGRRRKDSTVPTGLERMEAALRSAGRPLSVEELAVAMGTSTLQTVESYLSELRRRGMIIASVRYLEYRGERSGTR